MIGKLALMQVVGRQLNSGRLRGVPHRPEAEVSRVVYIQLLLVRRGGSVVGCMVAVCLGATREACESAL